MLTMTRNGLLTLACVVSLGSATTAQLLPVSSQASLGHTVVPGPSETSIDLSIDGADGPLYWLQANFGSDVPSDLSHWISLGLHPLAPGGFGSVQATVPTAKLVGLPPVHLRALFLEAATLTATPMVSTTLLPAAVFTEDPPGEDLDFAWGLGAVPQAAGAVVSQTQPWSRFTTISAVNNAASHPQEAILFDSSQTTGGDSDLATPGPGPGNSQPLGMLLIIPENDTDANGDELVDDPDDEQAGGVLIFDFAGPVNVSHLKIVDVDTDEVGGQALFYDENRTLVGGYMLQPLGDNSVQGISGARNIVRMEIWLAGSAGIGDMTVYPCETIITFDESSTGVPLGNQAGQDLTNDLALQGGLGIYFYADNLDPAHPDKCILFDSANPTGDDGDLVTPGYGPGNLTAEQHVLIIPEDDEDGDADGLVDDPDDEDAGGVLTMEWITSCGTFLGATILDVDEDELSFIEVVLNTSGSPSVFIPLVPFGDNSLQSVDCEVGPTRRVRFHFGGSAALAEVRICPDLD